MLVISRKQNETITIEPAADVDPDLTLKEAFAQGAIEIRLVQVGGRKVRLAIAAPAEMKIWRGSRRDGAGDAAAAASETETIVESAQG